MRIFVKLLCILCIAICAVSCNENSNRTSETPSGTATAAVDGQTVTVEWKLPGRNFTVNHLSGTEESSSVTTDNRITFPDLPSHSEHTFIIRSDTGKRTLAYAYVGERSQPGRISAAAYDGKAEIMWQALTGVYKYELYMSESEMGAFAKRGEYSTSSAVIDGLKNGKTYYFKVAAVYDTARTASTMNTDVSLFAVLPGYTFGEMTAVTPNAELDRHARVFKGYLRNGKVHFLWDAIVNAESYRLYSAPSADGAYELVEQVADNFYELPLPVQNKYYKMAAVFGDNSEGPLSQLIELIYRADADWTLSDGINAVTVNINNFSDYAKIDLACKGVDETAWFSTTLTHTPFNAGPLEPMDYDCRLSLKYSDNVEAISDIKRVTVYPAPTLYEKISVYVFENKARLRWDRSHDNDTYAVLLQADNGTLAVRADLLMGTVYTVTDLICGKFYTAYIRINRDNTTIISSPVEFELDFSYCESIASPVLPETEGINIITKLTPSGEQIVRQAVKPVEINNKMYLFGGSIGLEIAMQNDTWDYNPADGTDGKWTKLSPSGTIPPRRDCYAMVAINGKMYMFGGRSAGSNSTVNDTWVYDPAQGINGTWSKLSPATSPSGRLGTASTAYNGKFYVFGGGYNETWIFDPQSVSWSKGTYGPTINPYYKTAVTIDNRIYLFGGNAALRGGNPTNELWAYYPDNDTWRKLDPSNPITARGLHAATTYNNKMYVWAGDVGDHDFANDLWVYDPDNGTDGRWQKLTPNGNMPPARRVPTITKVNGALYLFSGYAMQTYGDMYKYEP